MKEGTKVRFKCILSITGWAIFSVLATHLTPIKNCIENSSYHKVGDFLEKLTGNGVPLEMFTMNLFVPIVLILLIFIIDFYLVNEEAARREMQEFIFLGIFIFFASILGLIQNASVIVKVASFAFMWLSLAFIKSAFHINSLRIKTHNIPSYTPNK